MTILTWPSDVAPERSAEFWLRTNTQQHVSPLNRDTQTLELVGAMWMSEIVLPPLDESEWRSLSAFIAQLAGPAGRFYYGPPYPARTARGLATGTPLVAGGSQTGRSLATDGWTPSITVLRKGDYIAFDTASGGRELKILTADATADGSGAATLAFAPPIRSSPLDNAAIIVSAPTCVVRLAVDDQGRMTYEEARHAGCSLSIVEAFRV